jgi:hypothetical protein
MEVEGAREDQRRRRAATAGDATSSGEGPARGGGLDYLCRRHSQVSGGLKRRRRIGEARRGMQILAVGGLGRQLRDTVRLQDAGRTRNPGRQREQGRREEGAWPTGQGAGRRGEREGGFVRGWGLG